MKFYFFLHRTFVESIYPFITNKSTIRLHTVIFTLYSLHIVRACARPSIQIFLLASMLLFMLCRTASAAVHALQNSVCTRSVHRPLVKATEAVRVHLSKALRSR